ADQARLLGLAPGGETRPARIARRRALPRRAPLVEPLLDRGESVLGPHLGEAGAGAIAQLAGFDRIGDVLREQEENAAALVALAHLAQQIHAGLPLVDGRLAVAG